MHISFFVLLLACSCYAKASDKVKQQVWMETGCKNMDVTERERVQLDQIRQAVVYDVQACGLSLTYVCDRSWSSVTLTEEPQIYCVERRTNLVEPARPDPRLEPTENKIDDNSQ